MYVCACCAEIHLVWSAALTQPRCIAINKTNASQMPRQRTAARKTYGTVLSAHAHTIINRYLYENYFLSIYNDFKTSSFFTVSLLLLVCAISLQQHTHVHTHTHVHRHLIWQPLAYKQIDNFFLQLKIAKRKSGSLAGVWVGRSAAGWTARRIWVGYRHR